VAQVFGTATRFTIRELTGDKRTLSLGARALPYRPFSLSGTQRLETTWYPGNPEATQQVFGAQEDATQIRGMWKDRFIKELAVFGSGFTAIAEIGGTQVGSVVELAKVVDDIRRKGQTLEVTWNHLVRRGIMGKFTQNWDRAQDLDWEISFDWQSQGDQPAPAVMARMDLSDIKRRWSRISNSLAVAISKPPFGIAPAFAARFFSAADKIQSGIDEVNDAISTVALGALTPPDGARRLVGVATSIQESSEEVIEIVASKTTGDSYDPDALATARFGQVLSATAYFRQTSNVARAARREAARQAAEVARRVNPNIIGSFVARQGQDLRDASTAFYETPDEWRRLLVFNGLTSSELSSGQVIFVPDLSAELRGSVLAS